MNIRDTMPGYAGRIAAMLTMPDGRIVRLVHKDHNVITYAAADIMARMLVGDDTYLPRHIGFIYGVNPSPLLVDPDTLPVDIRRQHDWTSITSDVAAINGNILIAPLALAPSLALDGSTTHYTGNAVVFTSHTGLVMEYGFPTTGSTFAPSLADLEAGGSPTPVYFYQVLLLNRQLVRSTPVYVPFARAAIGTAPFDPKPTTNHMAVYWTVTYK